MKNRLISLLRWSEHYTKTDMVYLTKNISWLTVSQVFVAAIAFLLSIAFAHFLSKEVYGTYRYLLSLFWTLTALTLTGLPTALARAISRGEDGAYRSSIRLSFIWSLPMVFVSFGLCAYYLIQGNQILGVGAAIIGVAGPFMQASFLYSSVLEGKQAFKINAISGVVLAVIPTLMLFGVMFISKDPRVYLAVYLLGNIAAASAIGLFVWKKLKHNNLQPSESIFRLGAHFSAMNVLSTVASQVDRLLVYHYLGAVELAIYVFATAMPDQIKGIASNVARISFPKFARRPLEEIRDALPFRLSGFTLGMVGVSLLYIVSAPFVFHILFPAYEDSVVYSQIYAVGLVFIGSIFPSTIFEAHAAKRNLYILNTASSLFQVLVLFFAIAWYGLLGAVIARILSRAFTFFISIALLRAR